MSFNINDKTLVRPGSKEERKTLESAVMAIAQNQAKMAENQANMVDTLNRMADMLDRFSGELNANIDMIYELFPEVEIIETMAETEEQRRAMLETYANVNPHYTDAPEYGAEEAATETP